MSYDDWKLQTPPQFEDNIPTTRMCDCCLEHTEVIELRTVTTPFRGSFITEEYCHSCVEHLRNQLK